MDPLKDDSLNLDDPEVLKALMGTDDDIKGSSHLFKNQDMVKIIEKYIDNEFPDEIGKHPLVQEFWAIIAKDVKLTFLEKEDIEDFEILFDQAMLNYLMSKPVYEYTFQDEQILDQLRFYIITALKRSQGFGKHKFNERIIEGGTINQQIRSNTDIVQAGGGSSGGIRGFLSKMF